MNKTCVFFLICINVGISTCQYVEPTVTFSLDKSSITKFPWMVIISNSSSMISYGSLIHPRVVLTLQLDKITPTVVTTLQVYANCFFQGPRILFDYKQHCSAYRNVASFNILENYSKRNGSKAAILTLLEPFVLNEDIGVIGLRQLDHNVKENDCGILSVRTLKSSSGSVATFFSLNKVKNISMYRTVTLMDHSKSFTNFVLFNAMGEESYEQFEGSRLELHFPGSPLVCKSTQNDHYVQLAVVNYSFVIFKNESIPSYSVTTTRRNITIDNTDNHFQKLMNTIIELV